MHVLIPFDVAPASERAVRHAIRVFGPHENIRITAVHLATDTADPPKSIAASAIKSMGADRGVSIDAAVRRFDEADSMAAIRTGICSIIEAEDVDIVVMGYEQKSFLEELFGDSTAKQVLENYRIPVTLVP